MHDYGRLALTKAEFDRAKEMLLERVEDFARAVQPVHFALRGETCDQIPSDGDIKRSLTKMLKCLTYNPVVSMRSSRGGLVVQIEKLGGRFVRASLGYVPDIPCL